MSDARLDPLPMTLDEWPVKPVRTGNGIPI